MQLRRGTCRCVVIIVRVLTPSDSPESCWRWSIPVKSHVTLEATQTQQPRRRKWSAMCWRRATRTSELVTSCAWARYVQWLDAEIYATLTHPSSVAWLLLLPRPHWRHVQMEGRECLDEWSGASVEHHPWCARGHCVRCASTALRGSCRHGVLSHWADHLQLGHLSAAVRVWFDQRLDLLY